MPINPESSPVLAKAFIIFTIPSLWSENHQGAPSCIFWGKAPCWKAPSTLASLSSSQAFRE